MTKVIDLDDDRGKRSLNKLSILEKHIQRIKVERDRRAGFQQGGRFFLSELSLHTGKVRTRWLPKA
ncbi:MAG: hypothetical protein B0A82_12720 [Alkalinema sp. CACIAM 70d]|nr:MAG: hypothetical protein B0A82_12720 [Alkalinema sp. CACIAM 70d]